MYRIVDWQKHFENNRTRELQRLEWIPVPNKQDGDGYRTVILHPRGLEIFAVWVLILEVASKCHIRGTLIRDSGDPHTPESLSRITGAPAEALEFAIAFLCDQNVGWLEYVSDDAAAVVENQDRESDQKRAHGRVSYALKKGRPLTTPLGRVSSRPSACQWCDKTMTPSDKNVTPSDKNFPGIVAHHLCGYGNDISDTTIIFVCRGCHALFESGRYTTGDVARRYGVEWMPQGIPQVPATTPQMPATTPQVPANKRLWNGMEENGIEEKRIEENGNGRAPEIGDDRDTAADVFRQFCEASANRGLVTPRTLTASRRAKLLTRLKSPQWRDALMEALSHLPLGGDWQPNFDWFLENDTNVWKVVEGKYDNWGKSAKAKESDPRGTMAAAERFLRSQGISPNGRG